MIWNWHLLWLLNINDWKLQQHRTTKKIVIWNQEHFSMHNHYNDFTIFWSTTFGKYQSFLTISQIQQSLSFSRLFSPTEKTENKKIKQKKVHMNNFKNKNLYRSPKRSNVQNLQFNKRKNCVLFSLKCWTKPQSQKWRSLSSNKSSRIDKLKSQKVLLFFFHFFSKRDFRLNKRIISCRCEKGWPSSFA